MNLKSLKRIFKCKRMSSAARYTYTEMFSTQPIPNCWPDTYMFRMKNDVIITVTRHSFLDISVDYNIEPFPDEHVRRYDWLQQNKPCGFRQFEASKIYHSIRELDERYSEEAKMKNIEESGDLFVQMLPKEETHR